MDVIERLQRAIQEHEAFAGADDVDIVDGEVLASIDGDYYAFSIKAL